MAHTLYRRYPPNTLGRGAWLLLSCFSTYGDKECEMMNILLCFKSSSSASWNIIVFSFWSTLSLLLLLTADIWNILNSFAGTVGWGPTIRCPHPSRTDNSFPWDIPLSHPHLPAAFQVCVLAGLTPPKHLTTTTDFIAPVLPVTISSFSPAFPAEGGPHRAGNGLSNDF